MDYKSAGVDIEAGYTSVELIKKHIKECVINVTIVFGLSYHYLNMIFSV